MKIFICLFSLLSFSSLAASLETVAQATSWRTTGDAKEAVKLCHEFQKKFPHEVRCRSFGKTPEGRDLIYLHVGNPKSPAVWVQAGIHAGEIDGKDAVFWLLKEIFQDKKIQNPLKGISLVFIPIVNPDGHERRGEWNRPNQNGPQETGWRTTAQNYNLNRDFMKTDAPEMIALLKLWHSVDPILSLDLHVTDGAKFQPEVGVIILPTKNSGDSLLHVAGSEFESELMTKLAQRGRMALPFYPSFEKDDDPMSGFSRYVALPRFSQGYWSTQNRLGVLVETHSWKSYQNRVLTHHDTVLFALEIARSHASKWMKTARELDHENLSEKMINLEFKHTDKSTPISFPGYKFAKEKSQISGAEVIHYDSTQKEDWKVPFYDELSPSLSVQAPKEGFIIPRTESAWLLPKLKVHGIKVEALKKIPDTALVFRISKKVLSPDSFEGHQTLKVEGEWKKERVSILRGSFFVPIRQSKAYLLLKLLEPLSQDSYLSWGFFNRLFERKEYMENYVTEDFGRELLKVPKVRKEFEDRLETDPDFAKSPEQRFEFFYRKHPSWDENMSKYPIFKI